MSTREAMPQNLISQWLSSGRDIAPHLKAALERQSREHISGIALSQLDSPMMRQFRAAKEEVSDALLFFRMGDFYELFGCDAIIASDLCGITLTSRDKSSVDPVPMAGVPVVNYKSALKKCVEAGFKVAVCDQVEDPKQAKGIVRREITRIATPAVPGDLYDDDSQTVQNQTSCYLASILKAKEGYTIAYVDAQTGEFRFTSALSEESLAQEIATLSPRELLTTSALEKHIVALTRQIYIHTFPTVSQIAHWILKTPAHSQGLFLEFFSQNEMAQSGVASIPLALEAVCGLLHYLKETQKTVLKNIQKIEYYDTQNFMVMDNSTKRHLDFFTTSTGEKKGSLFHFLNKCTTPAGSRLLTRRLHYPFKHKKDVAEALAVVKEIMDNNGVIENCTLTLRPMADLDRLLARTAQKSIDIRGLDWLRLTLKNLPTLFDIVSQYPGLTHLNAWMGTFERFAVLMPLTQALDNALCDKPAPQLGKGGEIFRQGFHGELDEIISLETNFQDRLTALEQSERQRSQIPSLKIGYNRVFGYYFEISKGKLSQVPAHFMRKQTLTNGERFITPELKELEDKALSASERRIALERELFENLRDQVLSHAAALARASEFMATLDVFLTFAKLSLEHDFCEPILRDDSSTLLYGNIHPVMAQNNTGEPFVKNNIELSSIHLITGPNMAGKSTLMRQVAISQILCQMGCFVPAQKAQMGLCDRILSRIGSSDHASRNQSTFMVEMLETAHILRVATPQSLLILDEVGRGTSTFDGISIAWSLLEYLHDHIGARTLFSTHYHELMAVCETRSNIIPMQMGVHEMMLQNEEGVLQKQIIFSRKYEQGHAQKSYGLHVAALAGLPEDITTRAQGILEHLETQKTVQLYQQSFGHMPAAAVPTSAPKKKKEKLITGATLF